MTEKTEESKLKVEYDEFGFVKERYCPYCGGPLKYDHTDDAKTDFFKCEKCGEQTATPKNKAREELAVACKKAEEAQRPISLSHLGMIEDPALAGKSVIVEAVVSSTSTSYLVPSSLKIEYEEEIQNPDIGIKDPVNIKLVGISDDLKDRRIRRLFGHGKPIISIRELAYRTLYRIRVRPPVFSLEKINDKIVDQSGYEYKPYDIYVCAEADLVFQPSSLVKLEGLCLPHPRTQQTTLLVYKVEFPEETQTFNVEKILCLKRKLQEKTVTERFDWVIKNFAAYAHIVSRENLAKSVWLTFFTPMYISLNNEIQKGWGNTTLYGDTTTAKTETVKKAMRLLKAGVLITAETASTVGLTGTATQIEKEGWFVDWGFLPLCDGKLLAVDGAHKLSLSNWASLAESERSGVVNIAKAAKATAYARTRQVKIANPVDREQDKFSTKAVASFLYPCQALPTIFDKTTIARLDFAAVSDQRDVNAKDINKSSIDPYEKDLELYSEVLKWCWSNRAKVIFTDEAIETLHEKATEFYEGFYSQDVPLASIDFKWKLARLSTALAYITLSIEKDNLETVVVTKDHVQEVAVFIKQEYANASLNILSQETRFEQVTLEEAKNTVSLIATKTGMKNEDVEKILKFIVLKGRVTKEEVKTQFSLSDKNELRPLMSMLSNENLLKVGRGFYPTTKLVDMFKLLTKKPATIDPIDTPEKGPLDNFGGR